MSSSSSIPIANDGQAAATSHRAIRIIYTARAIRGFGDGFAVIVLPAYLAEIGLDPFGIGVVATAALLGSATLTLAFGFLAVRSSVRRLLLGGAALMVVAGLGFSWAEHFAVLVAIAFIGTINPNSGDSGILVPLEHVALADQATDSTRTQVFATYSFIGGMMAAAGSLLAALPDALVSLGLAKLDALRVMFLAYAALGVLSAVLYAQLRTPAHDATAQSAGASALGPSRTKVYKLAALFSLDAFAGGFAVQSLVALWLFERFGVSLAAVAVFFFWSNVLSAFSYPVAVRLARRFGLINTMVFTHIPSSICLFAVVLASDVNLVYAFWLIRSLLSQMDVPTRTSYVMAVVTPPERAAAASVTAVPRSLAAALSPSIAGALLSNSLFGWPFVICGALKISYDLLLLVSFRHDRPPEERSQEKLR
jgi:MFS family permease